MSILETVQALELTQGGILTFPALGPGPNVITVRVAQGWARIVGIAFCPVSAPPAAAGTLEIAQSMDGTSYDHVDAFPLLQGGPDVTFDISVLARFVQVTVVVPLLTTMDVRIHGLLRLD